MKDLTNEELMEWLNRINFNTYYLLHNSIHTWLELYENIPLSYLELLILDKYKRVEFGLFYVNKVKHFITSPDIINAIKVAEEYTKGNVDDATWEILVDNINSFVKQVLADNDALKAEVLLEIFRSGTGLITASVAARRAMEGDLFSITGTMHLCNTSLHGSGIDYWDKYSEEGLDYIKSKLTSDDILKMHNML
jgi:hypothetical protein